MSLAESCILSRWPLRVTHGSLNSSSVVGQSTSTHVRHPFSFNVFMLSWSDEHSDSYSHSNFCFPFRGFVKQESPAIADKPARRESLPKLLQFDVLTTLSLTILAYLRAFSCCCVRNPRNPEKFTENSNLWSSGSSKVIDLGANRKPICDLLLVINSNFSRIWYCFRDIHG